MSGSGRGPVTQEGPNWEPGYYFPAKTIQDYLTSIPPTEGAVEPRYLRSLKEKVAVMTHDDEFDPKMFAIEQEYQIESTWFLLADRLDANIPSNVDVQLHFDKETGTLRGQIFAFQRRFGFAPRFNRNHRLLWKADNFDFPLLASHGILLDSTQIGTRPYRPCIGGRLLRIWEVPFSAVDIPLNLKAVYNVGASPAAPFRAGISPVVVLAHPFSVCERNAFRSCFQEAIDAALANGYRFLSLSRFYDGYCSASRKAQSKTGP